MHDSAHPNLPRPASARSCGHADDACVVWRLPENAFRVSSILAGRSRVFPVRPRQDRAEHGGDADGRNVTGARRRERRLVYWC